MIAALLLALAVQDTTPAPRLELNEVYRAVSVASPRIAAARALASAAHARVPGAKLPPDPAIQLAFMNYGLPDFAPMDPLGMMQVQVMQMIPTAGKLRFGGRAAGADAAAASETARDVEWEVRSEAAMAFYGLYATDRALAASRETLRLLQDIRSIAEAMYRVGEGRQADVLRAQVEIGRMAADTLRMRTMRVAMAGRLNALLNRNAEDQVASPLIPAFPAQLPALDSILSLAQTGRPMVRAGEREVEAAGIRSTLARRELWPDLTVGAQYGQRGSAMGIERMGSLMIGASIPIFARSRQLRMRDEMDAMHRMAEAELADMRARTRGDVMTAYATLVRARDLAALYRTTIIPQAEAAAASALAAYRVGTVDFMTLLDDRMTVNQYREQLYALEAEQGKAWAELEMLIGQELLETRTDR
jgi:outer membrane protein TolC